MNNDQKRTILAFTLSGIILFGWNAYFAPKNDPAVTNQVLIDNKLPTTSPSVVNTNTAVNVTPEAPLSVVSDIELQNGGNVFQLNSDFSFKNAKKSFAILGPYFQSSGSSDKPVFIRTV